MKVDLRHFGIVVEDLISSREFWETLGFEVIRDDFEDREFIFGLLGLEEPEELRTVKLSAGGTSEVMVELLEFSRTLERGYALPNSLGITHVALTVDSIAQVLMKLEGFTITMVSNAVMVNPEGTARVCYVRGPDGVLIELVELLD